MDNDKKIIGFEKKSIAKKAGLLVGESVLSINGKPVKDVFDYRFLEADSKLEITVEGVDKNSQNYKKTVNITKDENQSLGIIFANQMLCRDKSCANKCIFCFIDQMPTGMRDTLYFKDDDMLLSFLTGSYVTLTNISKADIERLADYHMSPINVSIHTLLPELRCKMLCNKNAEDVEEKIKILLDRGISVNGQIVLCPGVNDGEALKYTFDKILDFPDNFNSLAIVPVGLTKFRENLPELRTFTKEEALEIIKLVDDYARMALIKHGKRLFYASDELYIKAELPIPKEDYYDGYPQLENGVGMMRLLEEEVKAYIESLENGEDKKTLKVLKRRKNKSKAITIATGELAGDLIEELGKLVADFCLKKYNYDIKITVRKIENCFFGPEVTVAGLITGRDLIDQLKDKPNLGEKILITENMLKSDEDVFLDNLSIDDVKKTLGGKIKIEKVARSGADFVQAIIH